MRALVILVASLPLAACGGKSAEPVADQSPVYVSPFFCTQGAAFDFCDRSAEACEKRREHASANSAAAQACRPLARAACLDALRVLQEQVVEMCFGEISDCKQFSSMIAEQAQDDWQVTVECEPR